MYKKRLNLYHLISRSTYGVMVHIFAGLITYLLMAIYCAEEHGECVMINDNYFSRSTTIKIPDSI
jgi:hypothetical protein